MVEKKESERMTENQRKEGRNKVLYSLTFGFAIFLSILSLDRVLGENGGFVEEK